MDGEQPARVVQRRRRQREDCYAAVMLAPAAAVSWRQLGERPRMDQTSLLSRSSSSIRKPGSGAGRRLSHRNAGGARQRGRRRSISTCPPPSRRVRGEIRGLREEPPRPNLRATSSTERDVELGFSAGAYVNVQVRKLWPDEGSAYVQYAAVACRTVRIWNACSATEGARALHPSRRRAGSTCPPMLDARRGPSTPGARRLTRRGGRG